MKATVDRGPGSTVVEMLRIRAAEQPDQRAYSYLAEEATADAHLTYGELDRLARAVASRLQRQPCIGERALLLFPPGLDFLTAFFACMYAGVVAVPVPPGRRGRRDGRLAGIAASVSPAFVLTTRAISQDPSACELPELREARWLATDSDVAEDESATWSEPDIGSHSLALLQFTSGSTNNPKGVMISHGNLCANVASGVRCFEFGPADLGVSWVPHYHDMGLIGGVLYPSVAGFRSCTSQPRPSCGARPGGSRSCRGTAPR